MIISVLSHTLNGLSRQRVRQREGKYSTYRTYRPGVSQPLLRGKLQGLTSKSKVHRRNQNVSRTPNKNHWTPHSCDEEKQWRLQSQHNFLLFFPQTYMFCPFASPSLRNAVKETSSGITAGRHIHNSTSFRLAVTSSCPVNALPETAVLEWRIVLLRRRRE